MGFFIGRFFYWFRQCKNKHYYITSEKYLIVHWIRFISLWFIFYETTYLNRHVALPRHLFGGFKLWRQHATITKLTFMYPCDIIRLYSGNFWIFDHTQSIMNIGSSVCRAWKMLSNDTKISMIPWDPDIKNAFWNFCVGEIVGGQRRAVSGTWHKILWLIWNILICISWARRDAGGRGGQKTEFSRGWNRRWEASGNFGNLT